MRLHYLDFVLVLAIWFSSLVGVHPSEVVGADPKLVAPNGIARLPDGSLLISDIEAHCLFQIDGSGLMHVWGGIGQADYQGDGKHVSQASFNSPHDLKLDTANNAILVADTNNHRIRKIDLGTLVITTLAGNGRSELSGDGGSAQEAGLNNPQSIAVDGQGNVLIADTYNHVIRQVNKNGIITTVAGSTPGLSGDGGKAIAAQMNLPMAVAIGVGEQTILVSDAGNSRIRRVSTNGIIETICGVGTGSDDAGAGFSGDGELANKAKIFSVLDILPVSPNFLYLSDSGNNRLRTVTHGMIVSIAGSGPPGVTKNASGAALFVPAKMTLAPDGGLYFCERGNRRIRLLTKDGNLETVGIRSVDSSPEIVDKLK